MSFGVLWILWVVCGIYGALANVERIPRVYPSVKGSAWDLVQHAVTVWLGPIGLALVLSTGGRIKFWNTKENHEN